jgi:choline-glycine betaine transporter
MMHESKTKNRQVSHSWGILLGMLAIPLLALAGKLFPALDTLWTVLGVLFCALILRSAIGVLFPASASTTDTKARRATAQAR